MDNKSLTDTAPQSAEQAQQDQALSLPAGDVHQEPAESQPAADAQQDQVESGPPAPKKKGEKKIGSNRGVETVFRTNYDNHVLLSQLADGKANILISINGLIISVLIALISPRINSVNWAMLPVLILLVGCMMSLSFAIFASRPRLNRSPLTLEQVRRNKGNILFFGQFTRLSQEEFEEGMHEILRDRQLLYDNLIRDIYSMGMVLRKKYYYLQFAYGSFLLTLIIAVVTFIAVFLSAGSEVPL